MIDETQTPQKPKKSFIGKTWEESRLKPKQLGLMVLGLFILMIIIIAVSGGEEKKEITTEQESLAKQQTQSQTTPEISQEEQKESIEKSQTISDKEATTTIKIVLKDYGLYDIKTQIADGRNKGGTKTLILSYKSTATTSTQIAEEMGAILGCYISGVKNDWDIDELSVIVGDMQGNAAGMWYCDEEWTNDLKNENISMEELFKKVSTTITSL